MADSSDIVFYHSKYANLDESLKDILFDPEKLKQAGLITKELKGRGTTYFYKLQDNPVVLRHYWRGGYIQNFSKDAYVWTGLAQTRSYGEWKLLESMEELGLPVPRTVALRIQRSGLCYRSDIVTEEIEGVESLGHLLTQRPASDKEWQLIGQTIRRFHDEQVHHADLNANNLLLKEGECYLIDFDRGRIRRGEGWKESVIARLRRSLDKLSAQNEAFNFSEDNWSQLLLGYNPLR